MKKIFFTILIASLNLASYGQDFQIIPFNSDGQCGTVSPNVATPFTEAEINSSKFAATGTQYVMNVRVHYISNNILPANQELTALDLVGALNVKYNQANIFFKYKGFDNIANSTLLDIDNSDLNALFTTYASPDAIDIFINNSFFNTTSPGNSTTGLAITAINPANNQIYNKVIILRKDTLPVLNSVTPTNVDFKYYNAIHEMGHFLGLYHTHQQWKYVAGVLVTATDGECGLEENYNNSQWSILGDHIQDTNPDRSIAKYSNGTGVYTSATCAVRPAGWQASFACGTSVNFSLFNPPISNIMAYYSLCSSILTTGQYDYMRAFVASESLTGYFLSSKMNTIASLYLPYKREFFLYPNSDIVLGSTMRISARPTPAGYEISTFQKGFTYEIYDCDRIVSTNTTNINGLRETKQIHEIPSFPSPGSTFKILQVSPTIYSNCEPFPEVVRTDVLGGNDILLNNMTNPTINTLDATTIQSENFLSDLPQGLHVININLTNGETVQKTLIKQ